MDNSLSLYVHIPFCVKKCLYCDFLSFNAPDELIDEYFSALKQEILLSSEKYRSCEVKSVFFGGGTPSFLDSRYICDILKLLSDEFMFADDAEISIEVNPESAMKDKLINYRRAGFNRISIGAQSLNDSELITLGRAHNAEMFYETFKSARAAGFENINVDIMSALPNQSLEAYLDTLKKVLELRPEHISAYSLIVEEKTPFYDMDLQLPAEDVDRAMYHETKRLLSESGYHRYEISNYALSKENECCHNKVYWTRGNYLGLGLGASSMVGNVRWSNIKNIKKYMVILGGIGLCADKVCNELCDDDMAELPLKTLRENTEKLSKESQMEEFMFLGLRLTEGISLKKFKDEFGCDINAIYSDTIKKYIKMGLLETYLKGNDKYLCLTDKGLDVSNTVMADFLL